MTFIEFKKLEDAEQVVRRCMQDLKPGLLAHPYNKLCIKLNLSRDVAESAKLLATKRGKEELVVYALKVING